MLDKTYNHRETEDRIYKLWENSGAFQPTNDPKAPAFSIVLPPPNANGDLHVGHAMYVIEDILIRYYRMKGFAAVWVAGADHAGFETQFVFEKHLAKQGKSRFDYSRDELYQLIYDFVMENRGKMENQLRKLGFSLDWSRNIFTLDPSVIKIVYHTFKHLYDKGLIYRGDRLVNYCTRCGTSFSDLEVVHAERKDPLIFMKYGPFTITTVRPETKFRDSALAVNPTDTRYKNWIGETVDVMGLLGPVKMTVIADPEVDPAFGTGIMKVTPAHDFHDFELGKKYNLPILPIIDLKGKMDFSWFLKQKDVDQKYVDRARSYHGLHINKVRRLMLEDLKTEGLLVKLDENYVHTVGTCYRCGTVLEPILIPQWYIKVRPLADRAIAAGKKGKIKIFPTDKQKLYYQYLEKFIDWNISRQIAWGIRIPAWRCLDCSHKHTGSDLKGPEGLTLSGDIQHTEYWIITEGEIPSSCPKCNGINLEQDTDTFDTWFSSAQWPYATLQSCINSKFKTQKSKMNNENSNSDFERFYPLSVMETGYDILPAWVCRMAMIGLFETGKEPFKHIFLHGMVRDSKGQKMSKSKGNVVNPLEMVEKYGADALRFALIYGIAPGADVAFSEDKARGMRNFANKLWNIGRFLLMQLEAEGLEAVPLYKDSLSARKNLHPDDKRILTELVLLINKVTHSLDSYCLNEAADGLYEFTWHAFADKYLENLKLRISFAKLKDKQGSELTKEKTLALSVARHVYIHILKFLHPFMPFVTEEIWSKIPGITEKQLISASWPKKS